jgi:hypothetical protein
MATIIDALVVTLGLDTAAFAKGKADATKSTKTLTEEEKRAAKQIEDANKTAADSFKKVRNEVLSLLAIFTAGMGIKNFVESTVLSTAALGRMSQNLGMNAKDLAEWQLAAKNAGGSAQGITKALQDSQQAVAKFKIGQVGDDVLAFLRWGGKVSDLKDGNTYLLARSRIIHSMFEQDPGRAKLIAQQMGIDDDSFNLLKLGADGIQRLREQQARLAEEQARSSAPAEALRKQFDTLENTFQSIGVRVLTELMPVFDRLIVYMQRLADWVSDHKTDIAQWVDNAVTAVQNFVKWADKAADSVGGWKNVLIALAAIKILSAASPLLQLAGALSSVGGGLSAIALSGPAALAALVGLSVAAEKMRQSSFDKLIPQGPNHDQYVAEAVAGGVVTPDVDQPPPGGFGKIGQWFKQGPHAPRGIRNNNPGNIRYGDFAYKHGATGRDSGGFAIFPTMDAGIAAQRALLQTYLAQGNDTVRKVLSKYAPPSENDTTGYISEVSKKLGVGPDQRLSAANIDALSNAIFAREVGAKSADTLVSAAGRANAAQIASQGTGARDAASSTSSVSTSTSTAETNVTGPINIYTQAADAAGIARDFGSHLGRYTFTVPQANTGVS